MTATFHACEPNAQPMLSHNNVNEIQLETDFIEEMRTSWGYREVRQTLFHNSSNPRKKI